MRALSREEGFGGHSQLVSLLREPVAVRCPLGSFSCLPVSDLVAYHTHVAGYPPHVDVVSVIYNVCQRADCMAERDIFPRYCSMSYDISG